MNENEHTEMNCAAKDEEWMGNNRPVFPILFQSVIFSFFNRGEAEELSPYGSEAILGKRIRENPYVMPPVSSCFVLPGYLR